MIDPISIVFTRLKKAISKLCGNAGITNTDCPTRFPFLAVIQEDNADTSNDFENNENAVISAIKLESYSKISVSEAKKIMILANDEMRKMGYTRMFGPQEVANVADTKIKRLIARYQRIIGGGDTI